MNVPQVQIHNRFWPAAIVYPTGPHKVGTVGARLRISNRRGDRLAVRLWYPAAKATGLSTRLQTWWAKMRHPGWPPAFHGAPLADSSDKYPIITYVSGAPGVRNDNSYMLANLASHGFVLAAIEDPFASAGTAGAFGHAGTLQSDEAHVRAGTKAASDLLDAFERLPPASWSERLDLKRAGILGFALGGAVAVAAPAYDVRYIVAASLDGTKVDDALVKVPYLLFRSDRRTRGTSASSTLPNEGCRRCQASLPTSHIIEIEGTEKHHFSDRLIASLSHAGEGQRTVGMRVRAILNAYTVAFFKMYMLSISQPLMRVRHSPYPQVRFVDHVSDEAHYSWSEAEISAGSTGVH
jgi:dienelactone hydrolase